MGEALKKVLGECTQTGFLNLRVLGVTTITTLRK
jgi:hypothetical protein